DGRLDDLSARIARLNAERHLPGSLGLAGQFFGLLLAEAREDPAALQQLQANLDPAMLSELPPSQRAGALVWFARVCARVGQVDFARMLLATTSLEDRLRKPVKYGDLGRLCSLAETLSTLGEREGAAALYAVLHPYAERNAVGVALEYGGSVEHYLGL